MRVFESLSEFETAVGEELGASDWTTITQEQVNQFADATGDHQWIHVDQERAKEGPFGGTIVHGFLTLSMVPVLISEVYRVDNLAMGINYGAEKLRFPHPVPVGSRVRARATLSSLTAGAAGSQARIAVVIEIEGVEKPGCVVEVIFVLAAS